jgi:hypothetical protein
MNQNGSHKTVCKDNNGITETVMPFLLVCKTSCITAHHKTREGRDFPPSVAGVGMTRPTKA